MDELISVIMPNYNGEKYIAKSIESVINQSYKKWELIIVDDCSKDSSIKIIDNYSKIDERIKYFINDKNSGAAVTRNNAISHAKGRFIAFLDSDDIWFPFKLEKQIKFMVDNGYSFSCSWYLVIDEKDNDIMYFKPKKRFFKYKDIMKTCDIGCLTVVIDKNTINNVYMPINATKREDFACWLQILKETDCYCIQENLAKYRQHNSVSSNKFKMASFQWNVYRRIERKNIFSSFYYLLCWAFYGIKKYKKIKKDT